eukprot:31265-Pelagococcus_subviridis.AAC.21
MARDRVNRPREVVRGDVRELLPGALGHLRRPGLRSKVQIRSHVPLRVGLVPQDAAQRLARVLVLLAQRGEPEHGPALDGDARGEQIHDHGLDAVVHDVRLRAPFQQRARDPIEPRRLRGGRLRVGVSTSERSVHRAETLHYRMSHARALVPHALA